MLELPEDDIEQLTAFLIDKIKDKDGEKVTDSVNYNEFLKMLDDQNYFRNIIKNKLPSRKQKENQDQFFTGYARSIGFR
jgi:hypothetical protein